MFQEPQSDGAARLTFNSFEATELGFEPREADSQSLGPSAPALCLLPGGPGDPGECSPHWRSGAGASTLEFLPGSCVLSTAQPPSIFLSLAGQGDTSKKSVARPSLRKGRQAWTSRDPEIKGPRPESGGRYRKLTGLIHSHPGHCPNKCIAWVSQDHELETATLGGGMWRGAFHEPTCSPRSTNAWSAEAGGAAIDGKEMSAEMHSGQSPECGASLLLAAHRCILSLTGAVCGHRCSEWQ